MTCSGKRSKRFRGGRGVARLYTLAPLFDKQSIAIILYHLIRSKATRNSYISTLLSEFESSDWIKLEI